MILKSLSTDGEECYKLAVAPYYIYMARILLSEPESALPGCVVRRFCFIAIVVMVLSCALSWGLQFGGKGRGGDIVLGVEKRAEMRDEHTGCRAIPCWRRNVPRCLRRDCFQVLVIAKRFEVPDYRSAAGRS